jgi:DNA repair protein RadC
MKSSKRSYLIRISLVGEPQPSPCVNTPELALRYWRDVIAKESWFDEQKEQLVVLLLSARLFVQGYSLVSVGSLNESVGHPREVFREAVGFPAYAIIVIHNHPSGDPRPSFADCTLTERLVEAGNILQVQVLDHLIIGRRRRQVSPLEVSGSRRITKQVRADQAVCRRGYYSFREVGVIKPAARG